MNNNLRWRRGRRRSHSAPTAVTTVNYNPARFIAIYVFAVGARAPFLHCCLVAVLRMGCLLLLSIAVLGSNVASAVGGGDGEGIATVVTLCVTGAIGARLLHQRPTALHRR